MQISTVLIVLIFCFSVILAVGVKESTMFNNIFTGVNLLVVIYSVICGAFKADTSNWDLPPHNYSVKVCLNSVIIFIIHTCYLSQSLPVKPQAIILELDVLSTDCYIT